MGNPMYPDGTPPGGQPGGYPQQPGSYPPPGGYPPAGGGYTQPGSYPPPGGGYAGQPSYPQQDGPPPYNPAPYQQPYNPAPYGQPQYPQAGDPQPPKRSRLPLILGIVGGVLVLCCALPLGVFALNGGFKSIGNITTATATTSGPTATPTPVVVYSDSLTGSASSDGWSNDADCSFKPDGFHILGAFICYAPPDAVGDMNVDVTVKQVSGSTNRFAGIVFRRPSKGNYYTVQTDGLGHWFVDKDVNGTVTTILDKQSSSALHTGANATNTLSVHALGGHMEFFANGTRLGAVDDATFTTGLVGLVGDDQSDYVFTNIKITKPAA